MLGVRDLNYTIDSLKLKEKNKLEEFSTTTYERAIKGSSIKDFIPKKTKILLQTI